MEQMASRPFSCIFLDIDSYENSAIKPQQEVQSSNQNSTKNKKVRVAFIVFNCMNAIVFVIGNNGIIVVHLLHGASTQDLLLDGNKPPTSLKIESALLDGGR